MIIPRDSNGLLKVTRYESFKYADPVAIKYLGYIKLVDLLLSMPQKLRRALLYDAYSSNCLYKITKYSGYGFHNPKITDTMGESKIHNMMFNGSAIARHQYGKAVGALYSMFNPNFWEQYNDEFSIVEPVILFPLWLLVLGVCRYSAENSVQPNREDVMNFDEVKELLTKLEEHYMAREVPVEVFDIFKGYCGGFGIDYPDEDWSREDLFETMVMLSYEQPRPSIKKQKQKYRTLIETVYSRQTKTIIQEYNEGKINIYGLPT